MKIIDNKISKLIFLILDTIESNSLVVILIFLLSINSNAQVFTNSISGANNYTIPAGVTAVNVQIWGSGGSGAGGGGYSTKTFNVTPSDLISYNIGAGAAAAAAGSNGNNGNITTATHGASGTSMTANGGTKGNANSPTGGTGGSATGGSTNISGASGGAGATSTGGNGGNGGNTTTTGGAGQTNANGFIGTVPGGGGGGGEKGASSTSGGAGGNGQIIITCNPTITALSTTSGCVGSTITITGNSFVGITAANVTIGGTPVASITSFTQTSIVAVVGTGTSGTVSVTNIAGTGTSASTFTVNPLPTTPTIITPTSATSVCSGVGTSINLNATSSGNTIYWYTVASGGTSIGNVAGGTNLTVTPSSTTTYYAEAHSASGCVSPRVATATVTYITSVVPTIEFTQGANDTTYTLTNMCGTITGGGQNDLDIATGNPGGSATYQWQVSYDGGTTWVNGPGPTSITTQYVLDPAYTIYETTSGIYYFRIIITNLGCSATSSPIKLTTIVGSNLTPGAIAGNQTFCGTSANPVAFTQITSPTGGNGTFTYQWQSSTNNVNFTDISGATSSTYDAPTITQTTYYRRVVITGGCGAYSNTIIVYIGAPTIAVTTPSSVCYNITAQTTTLPFTLAGLPVTYSITWNALPTNSFAAISNATLPSSTITINIPSGTAAGTYTGNIVVTTASGCSSTSVPFTVTVVPNLPASIIIGASATTICSGTSVTFSTTPTNGGVPSYQWKVNGVNVPGETLSTFSSTTLANNDVVTVVMTSTASPCLTGSPATSNSITITVNSNPLAPIIDVITAPTCALSTGSFHFNNLPASGSWTLTQSGTVSGSSTGSGTTTTVSGLAPGSYTYIITNSNGCISPASSVTTMTGLISTTWNGIAWTNGIPTIDNDIIFSGPYSSTGNLSGCSCTVNSGSIVFNPTHSLTLTNNIKVSGGSLTFANNSSLIQTNASAINTGSITYNRNASMKQYDYVYWSSPVNGFNINNLSLTQTPGPKYIWNPTVANSNGGQGNWADATGNTMAAGKGYIVRAPSSFTPTAAIFSASFVGVPNNGTITAPVSRGSLTGASFSGANGVLIDNLSDNWNLIGNPYPSSIRAAQFLFDNQSVIEGSVRLWTHSKMPSNTIYSPFYGSFTYNYTPNDYLTYNFTGTSVGPTSSSDLYIGAGQGFFVEMLDGPAASSTVTFSNGLRSSYFDNSTFYKSTNQNVTNSGEKDRIWLDLVSSSNTTDRTLIGYIDGATNAKDNLYDASYTISNGIGIYSLLDNDKMTIQGKGLPFDASDVVPVGLNITTSGNYTIAIGAVDGLFDQQNIYIEDTYLNVISDLKQSPYSFSSAIGIFNDRFKLRYTTAALGTNTVVKNDAAVKITTTQNEITIISNADNISKIEIFDTLGKLLVSKNNLNTNEYSTELNAIGNQIVFVKVTLENQQLFIKKAIVN